MLNLVICGYIQEKCYEDIIGNRKESRGDGQG